MKKQLSITIGCLLLMAGLAFGQQSINLYTMGSTSLTSTTVAPTSTFSIDTYTTFTGFTGGGLSYWLEVSNGLASAISGTGETYFTWTDPNQTFFGSDPFNQTTGTDAGFMNTDRDLGGTSVVVMSSNVQDQPAGTYKVSTVNFSLTGAAPGTYFLQTQNISPHRSEVSADPAAQHFFDNQAVYTIIVSAVPEPAIWSLFALGGLAAFGVNLLRARRRS